MIGISIANSLGLNRVSGINPDAAAFIQATGITGTTEVNAINSLVAGLQADGLWSKMKAVYPFVTDNRNLLGYTEAFDNAAWIKSGATVTANNILAPDGTMTADRVVFGAANNFIYQQSTSIATTANKSIYLKGTAGETISLDDTQVLTPSNVITLTGDWQRINFTSTTVAAQPQGLAISTFQSATARTIWVWGAQLELGSTATTYQSIATTQQAYIASQFKWNLKDPRDLDAAFRLVFNGGWTHSSTGATPNGTNGYADTKIAPLSVLAQNSTHLSYYSRTDISALQVEMGLYEANKAVYLLYDFNGLGWKGINSADTPSGTIFTPTNGMLIGNRPNATTENYFHKGSLSQTITRNSVGLSAFKILLGSYNTGLTNSPLYYSTKQCAFSTIGDGLTDTDAANLYTRVQAFQTSLSRQV